MNFLKIICLNCKACLNQVNIQLIHPITAGLLLPISLYICCISKGSLGILTMLLYWWKLEILYYRWCCVVIVSRNLSVNTCTKSWQEGPITVHLITKLFSFSDNRGRYLQVNIEHFGESLVVLSRGVVSNAIWQRGGHREIGSEILNGLQRVDEGNIDTIWRGTQSEKNLGRSQCC